MLGTCAGGVHASLCIGIDTLFLWGSSLFLRGDLLKKKCDIPPWNRKNTGSDKN